MDIKTLKENAREKWKDSAIFAKLVMVYGVLEKVPGMGGTGSGSSFKVNYEV